MIDHVVLTVRNLEASLAFYQRALKALGHDRRVTYEGHHGHAKLTGLGDDRETYILLREGAPHPRAVHLGLRRADTEGSARFLRRGTRRRRA